MERWLLAGAALSGLVAVSLGALGAHSLESKLGAELLAVWNTAAHYHLVHSVAAVVSAVLMLARPGVPAWLWAGSFFLAGSLLFSGSLYLLAVTGWQGLGIITPVGGLAFLVGWAMLAWGAWRFL